MIIENLDKMTNEEITEMLFDKASKEEPDELTMCFIGRIIELQQIDNELRAIAKRLHNELLQVRMLLLSDEGDDDK